MYRDMALALYVLILWNVWFLVSIHCIDVSILSQAVNEGAPSKPNISDTPIQHVQAVLTTVLKCHKNSKNFRSLSDITLTCLWVTGRDTGDTSAVRHTLPKHIRRNNDIGRVDYVIRCRMGIRNNNTMCPEEHNMTFWRASNPVWTLENILIKSIVLLLSLPYPMFTVGLQYIVLSYENVCSDLFPETQMVYNNV